VEQIAGRAAVGEFWRVLADFAVSAVVPKRAQGSKLTQQPFIAWHVVLSDGNGLRVVRHYSIVAARIGGLSVVSTFHTYKLACGQSSG
jgi:hypothetical protein